MLSITQWSLRRPGWVTCLAWSICTVALLCVAYASLLLVLPILFLVWRLRHHPRLGLYPLSGLLYINNEGDWGIEQDGRNQVLALRHIWSGPVWTTLQFAGVPADNKKGFMLELTIWRSSVPPGAWRQLQVLMARQLARRGPPIGQGV